MSARQLSLVSAVDGGVTMVSAAAASQSCILKEAFGMAGDEMKLPGSTDTIAICCKWLDKDSEGTDMATHAGTVDLSKTPSKFAGVVSLADFLALHRLLDVLLPAMIWAKASAASELLKACRAAVPNLPAVVHAHRARLITASVVAQGPQAKPDADWCLQEYVRHAYPEAGEKMNDRGPFAPPLRLLKLLFSTVARGDAATLRAALEDSRVIGLRGQVSFNGRETALAFADLDDKRMTSDEDGVGVTLLQFAAERDAAECAEVILATGAEAVSAPGVWGCRALHAACWNGSAATLRVLLTRASAVDVNQTTDNGYAWQGRCTSEMGSSPLHLCYLGAIARKRERSRPPFDRMRSARPLMQLILRVQAEPSLLRGLLEELARTQPELVSLVKANQAEFMALLNNTTPHAPGFASRAAAFAAADGGNDMARACAAALLDAGADVHATTGPVGGSLLGPAMRDNNSGASYSEGFEPPGRPSQLSCLHLAVLAADAAGVQMLLERGARQAPSGWEGLHNFRDGELQCPPPLRWGVSSDTHGGRATAKARGAEPRLAFGALPCCLWAPPLSLALVALSALEATSSSSVAAASTAGGAAVSTDAASAALAAIVVALAACDNSRVQALPPANIGCFEEHWQEVRAVDGDAAAQPLGSLVSRHAALLAALDRGGAAADDGGNLPKRRKTDSLPESASDLRGAVQKLLVIVRPKLAISPAAADYVLAMFAPVVKKVAASLVAAAPPAPPADVDSEGPFAVALRAALRYASFGEELTRHALSEGLKAIRKHKPGAAAGGSLCAFTPALMRQLLGLESLSTTGLEQQLALTAVLEYLVYESIELAANICDDTDGAAFAPEIMGPRGWERLVAKAAADSDGAVESLAPQPRAWALPPLDGESDEGGPVLFAPHVLLGLMRDESFAELLPEWERPPPPPAGEEADADGPGGWKGSPRRQQHERAAVARCWRLDPGLKAALTSLRDKLPLTRATEAAENDLQWELEATFAADPDSVPVPYCEIRGPGSHIQKKERDKMCEAAYFRSVKVQFLEHSRRLLELSDDDELQAWFEPHFAAGMRLIAGGTGGSCGADTAAQEGGAPEKVPTATVELSALLHARGETDRARQALHKHHGATVGESAAAALLHADVLARLRDTDGAKAAFRAYWKLMSNGS
jgi:hypothetical protein